MPAVQRCGRTTRYRAGDSVVLDALPIRWAIGQHRLIDLLADIVLEAFHKRLFAYAGCGSRQTPYAR